MADIVRLHPSESPPDTEDWALVTRDTSGQFVGSGSVVTHSRGATFYVPIPAMEDELEAAVAKAVAWADEHGVKTVYVQEGINA
jgi:hypothetical protein